MKKTSFSQKWLFIACFWLILGLAMGAQVVKDFPVGIAVGQTIIIVAICFVGAHTLSDILLPKALANNKMKIFILQSVVMVLVLAFFITLIPYLFYHQYIMGTVLDSPEKSADYSQLLQRSYNSIPSALLIGGTACGLRFYQEHSLIEKNHAILQQVHLEAQLRILQDQINPHLMFNVLNHIHILMKKDVELASTLLIRFSDILRYQLYECNREFVTLEKELKYLKDLVAIEQTRWGNELEVSCKWAIQDGKSQISPMLLVPFVENAFKHVSRLPTAKGYVNLELVQEGDLLTLQIENSNSAQQPRRVESAGIGLENVQKRLEILYLGKHELVVAKAENTFKINLKLQLNPTKS